MARDLFAERGIVPKKMATKGRDLFVERGIVPKNRMQPQEQVPEESFLSGLGSKFMSGVTGFNTAIERPIHGILQPLVENQYVPERLRNASKQVAASREANYEREVERNPFSAMAGNIGGNVALFAPALMSGAGVGMSPYLAGALSGGAQAGAQYVNPEESRLENALYGGAFGALLPAAGKAIGGLAKGVKNIAKSYPAAKVAEKVISGKADVKAKYAKEYSDIFKQSGIKHIREPIKTSETRRRLSINGPIIKRNNPEKYGEAFAAFQKNPTPKLAQKAQSDLGKLINEIKSGKPSSLSSEGKRIKELTKLRKGVINDITKSLEKKSPELANKYKKVGEGYAKDVIPYSENKAIREFEKGRLSKEDLTDALVKNKAFREQMKNVYPELKTRRNMPKIITGLGATGLAHKYGVFDALLGGNHE